MDAGGSVRRPATGRCRGSGLLLRRRLLRAAQPELLDQIVARRQAVLPECGATLLDEYLAREFDTVLEVGEYAVLWRELER